MGVDDTGWDAREGADDRHRREWHNNVTHRSIFRAETQSLDLAAIVCSHQLSFTLLAVYPGDLWFNCRRHASGRTKDPI